MEGEMKQGIINKVLGKVTISFLLIGMMLTVSACSFSPFSWSKEKVKIDQEESFSIENLSRITAGTASADIKVIVTDEKELKIHFYGDVKVASAHKDFAPYINVDKTGTTLVLMEKINSGLNSVSYSGSVKLDIYVPKNYSEDIKLNTASGHINIKDFEGGGDINTASGEINIENCRGSFSANTVSGDILYKKDAVLDNNLNINSVSGDIDISISKDSEFKLKTRSVSGKTKCDFPVILDGRGAEGTVGSGKNNITANTVSGDITVKRNLRQERTAPVFFLEVEKQKSTLHWSANVDVRLGWWTFLI
jgi:lia operon protein LiaG